MLKNVDIIDFSKSDPKIYHLNEATLTVNLIGLIKSNELLLIIDVGNLKISDNPNPPERTAAEEKTEQLQQSKLLSYLK